MLGAMLNINQHLTSGTRPFLTPVMSLLHASQEWMVGSAFGSMLMAASLSSLLAGPNARMAAKSRALPAACSPPPSFTAELPQFEVESPFA